MLCRYIVKDYEEYIRKSSNIKTANTAKINFFILRHSYVVGHIIKALMLAAALFLNVVRIY